jgi:hypothetical protein
MANNLDRHSTPKDQRLSLTKSINEPRTSLFAIQHQKLKGFPQQKKSTNHEQP